MVISETVDLAFVVFSQYNIALLCSLEHGIHSMSHCFLFSPFLNQFVENLAENFIIVFVSLQYF